MTHLDLKSWSDFGHALRKVDQARHAAPRVLHEPLFRGLGNSKWGLETTLERSYSSESCSPTSSLLKYYRKASASQPVIETFSGKRWEKLPEIPEFEKLVKNCSAGWIDMLVKNQPELLEYMVYLRHHGFPSPILDWTASPYVAAFFAFDSPPRGVKRVCVYAVSQDSIHSASSDAELFFIGRYMRTDPRHFHQQCQYTMCIAPDPSGDDYLFPPHVSGLDGALGPKGKLFRITMPIGDRVEALKQLDLMNINKFTLFSSEDSLISTVARREWLFRE